RLADFVPATLVFAIGEDDHRLAAGLLVELFVRGQVHRIVKQRSLGRSDGGNGATARSGNARRAIAARSVDFRFRHGSRKHAGTVGVVLQQVHVHVEREQKRLVFRLQHALQELASRVLFQGQNPLLAAGGIQQDAQSQRLMRLGHEVLQRLRRLVLGHAAVVLGQVRNQVSSLVFDREKDVDQVDLYLEGGHRFFIGRRRGSGADRGSIRRRGKLCPSRCRQRRQAKQHREQGGNSRGNTHDGHLDGIQTSKRAYANRFSAAGQPAG